MGRKIMISDIHGCSKTFIALLDKLEFSFDDELFLLGDYVDRGLDSKGVLDHIIHLIDKGYKVIPIKGNHEAMLLSNYIAEAKKGWYNMADQEFLSSFNISDLTQLPIAYIHFCENLAYYHLEQEFIAVHAGLNFNTADPLENKKDLMWIREWYSSIDYDWLDNRIIIHGHTPQSRYEIEEQFHQLNDKLVINIDCGAVLSKQKHRGLGILCAFDFTNRQLLFQENIEEKSIY